MQVRGVPLVPFSGPVGAQQRGAAGANGRFADRYHRSQTAEAQLYAEKERAQVTLASIGDAVVTTDTNGLVSI